MSKVLVGFEVGQQGAVSFAFRDDETKERTVETFSGSEEIRAGLSQEKILKTIEFTLLSWQPFSTAIGSDLSA